MSHNFGTHSKSPSCAEKALRTGLAGFEPTTYRLGGGRSILLSYSPRIRSILPDALATLDRWR